MRSWSGRGLQAQHELPANAAHRSLAVARFQPFMETLRSSKITTLAEGKPVDKEAYRRKLAKDLGLNAEQHEK